MKTVSPATLNTITNDYHNVVGSVVFAEWNLNRYYNTVVDNTPSEQTNGYDIEFFPIESIVESNRPEKSGICKALVGQAFVSENNYQTVPSARFYTVDVDDEYKYWQSPQSSVAGTFAMSNCAPQVLYYNYASTPAPIQVKANKISFTVENTFAKPVDYDVQVKYTTGGSWTTVASDIAIPATGRIQLWYDGTDWTTTPSYDDITSVHGVRLVINSMDKVAYFNLIELGFRIESDVSADVESWSDTFSMGEVDFITPLGSISSNGGSVTLFNDTGTWTNSSTTSPYYNLLDKGVKFTCFTKYGSELIPEFEFFSDTWDEAIDNTTVTLVDASKFFMETKPRAVLYQNISVQEAVWRICDIIGFNKYEITTLDTSQNSVIDIFWTDGDKTAWEVFSDLSRATQTAIYFDSKGVLQVKTRDAAWDNSQFPVYDFIRDSVPGGQPANMVSFEPTTKYEANKITVNYKPTGFSEKRDNIIPFETVWEPDGNVVLRASPLATSISASSGYVNLAAAGRTWPFSGIMQIEGEWISYDAKEYVHYDASNVRRKTWVTSLEHQQRLDSATGEFYRHLNSYTGILRVKERGLYNTEPAAHSVTLAGKGWSTYRQKNYGANVATSSGFSLNPTASTFTISTGGVSDNDYHYLVRGSALDAGYYYLGTRLKINNTAHKYKAGGIFFNAGPSLGTGYYLEVMATSRMNAKMRKSRNEIILYSMKADGSKKIFGGQEIKIKNKSKNNKNGAKVKKDIGARFAVPANSYIDIDIYVNGSRIRIFANGKEVISETITGSWVWPNTGRFGLFAHGNTSITFDYVYAIYNNSASVPDVESYFDRIDSSWVGNQWMKDWTYQVRSARRKVKKKWVKYQQLFNQRFYDEFGPMCHEIREFDIKFTSPTPVLESKLYSSNSTQILATGFIGDVSGAKFTLANYHRVNAVANGDDTLTAGGNTINHKLLVYGRPVIQKDAQKVERTDEWSLRRRGPIEIEYESPWIQNKQAAESLADWLATHWTRTDTDIDTEVFGNPLIELTDVVHVSHGDINDNFYVTGVSNSWDNGLSTTLNLRKVT